MKLAIFVSAIAASLGISSAAPAIIWKSDGSSSSPSHQSEQVDVRSIISSTVGGDHSSSLSAVVFLVGRKADGSEGLTSLASSGNLPGVQEKYNTADSIHYHVNGLESSRTVARDARQIFDGTVVEVSLGEFNRKLTSLAQNTNEIEEKATSKSAQKRKRDISDADVLVVNISPAEENMAVDSSVVAAIDSPAVRNVVLSSIRSVEEVKRARTLLTFQRNAPKSNSPRKVAGRRRLDDEAEGEENNNQNDNEVIYYVNMTPNIFAGILFFLLFVFVANTGLRCMGQIQGQEVFVTKMPTIGREA